MKDTRMPSGGNLCNTDVLNDFYIKKGWGW